MIEKTNLFQFLMGMYDVLLYYMKAVILSVKVKAMVLRKP